MPWPFRIAVAAALLFGIYLRVDSLGAAHYWYDEAITSLRVAGYTERDVQAYLRAHPQVTFGELGRFRTVGEGTTAAATVRSLAEEDPQHPPLYYLTAREVARVFGTGLGRDRVLPALFGVLSLPAVYWLALELFVHLGAFRSKIVCGLAASMLALAPYHVLYSRQHREYSLWTLLTIVTVALFLRAFRKDTSGAWIAYALALAFSVYSHLFGVLTAGVLGLFALTQAGFRARFWHYLGASAGAGVLCLPWAYALLTQRAAAAGGMSWAQVYSAGKFQFVFSLTPVLRSVDLAVTGWGELLPVAAAVPLGLALPVGLALALTWFGRGPRKPAAILLGLLIVSASGTLFVMDYVTGSSLGWAQRYVVPSTLGWSLTAAFVIGAAVEDLGPWSSIGTVFGAAILGSAAVASSVAHLAPQPFATTFYDVEAIDYLNHAERPVVLSDEFVGPILALNEYVRPETELVWTPRCFTCTLAVTPPVSIPEAPANGNLFYYRTWDNMAPEAEARALMNDQFNDPRYHTKPAPLLTPTHTLFELKRK